MIICLSLFSDYEGGHEGSWTKSETGCEKDNNHQQTDRCENTSTDTDSQEKHIIPVEKTCCYRVSSKYIFVRVCLTVWSKQEQGNIIFSNNVVVPNGEAFYPSSPFHVTRNRHTCIAQLSRRDRQSQQGIVFHKDGKKVLWRVHSTFFVISLYIFSFILFPR